MNKPALRDAVIAVLTAELDTLHQAAKEARAYATDEESRAEDKHDTRAIEASYLADGQERAALEASQALEAFRNLAVRPFNPGEPIAVGALVELEISGQRERYLMGPSRGGLVVTLEETEVLVITPQSPIGRKLLGRREGDSVMMDAVRPAREARIVSVQ